MKKQKSGSIIITLSTAGIFGFSHRSPYVNSKWGVIGLMKCLAIELGPYNVKVNSICPGSVEGERLEKVIEAEVKSKGMTKDNNLSSLYRRNFNEKINSSKRYC